TLFKLEQGVRYNRLQHRADILVYDRAAKPLLLVECKAPHVHLNDDTWSQIARYNASVNARLLVITNGLQHFCWQLDYERGNHTLLPSIPSFDTLVHHKPIEAANG
ncbi:MAG: type I restriction enzyme HsdR N-terminal domain-containing protein, partial [Bacteroidota bacterium]